MIATFNGNYRNAKNLARDKELVNRLQVVAAYKGKLYRVVDARFWMGRSNSASVVYCSIWVHSRHKDIDCSGYGTAGGGNYHKESEALDSAIKTAGINLWTDKTFTKIRHIDGAGKNAMKDAVEAIARGAGFRGQLVTV
jgi:hypothetical protein